MVVWYVHRRTAPSQLAVILPAVLATVVAVGCVVQVVRIGESGSRAVWTGVVSSQPRH